MITFGIFSKKTLRFALAAVGFFSFQTWAATDSINFTGAPPFVQTTVGKPNVVIALDISGSMKINAYRDLSAGNWNRGLHQDFDPTVNYYGYFETDQMYSYQEDVNKQFFAVDALGGWNGNFLNWLTMRRMDVVRKVLTGGRIPNRDGDVIDGQRYYIIEGQNEPVDNSFRKRYSRSSTVSPIPDNTEFLIANGEINVNNSANKKVLRLSDKVEVGQVNISRNVGDPNDDFRGEINWTSVSYENSYINPIVVVNALTHDGGDYAHARVRNVTPFGFEVRLEEWAYRDINHTDELVTYIVAEDTGADNPNLIEIDGTTYDVFAGERLLFNSITSTTITSTMISNQPFSSTSVGYTPIVFAGVSSQNSDRPVITRVRNIDGRSFDIALQNEEDLWGTGFFGRHPAPELVHWIAMEPVSGRSDFGNVQIEVGDSGGDNVDERWRDVSFDNSDFSEEPIVAVAHQTLNGADTAYPRYRNPSTTGFSVFMEEEKSKDDEVGHADERIGYLAVQGTTGMKIRVAADTEPKGVVQQNSASMRIGLAVYNYDHTDDPTGIYNGNTTHGGTLNPCYPDISLPTDERSNFDICYETHVKSPINNIIKVIEDHPLIWGTTPIAEALYDIKGYFSQTDHNRNAHADHPQWYANGTENIPGNSPFDGKPKARPSYEVNNDWDPFYYDEFNTTLPCAKSFVLHFNDGEPYRDFDGNASQHPVIVSDGVGPSGAQEALDDIALDLRKNDCRGGLNGRQEIVSYYVFAALGESPESSASNSTSKVLESAVNGGFIDADGDHIPDPLHPADIVSYIRTGSTAAAALAAARLINPDVDPSGFTTCEANEWDNDADCIPDTFYFANDGEVLVRELNETFEDIITRAASGGAASVISASRSGEGNVVNAIFRPSATVGEDEVAWIGDVHALMIDSRGALRQDDGDLTLEDPSADPYVDMCSNDVEKIVRVKLSGTLETRPTPAQTLACSNAVFNVDLFDLDYLWSGAEWLSSLSDAQAISQRPYISTTKGRHIISGVDSDGDGMVQNDEDVPFLTASFPEDYAGLLSNDLATSQEVINWIRGQDIDGYRSRQLNGQTMRLGDIIYSTPTIVGRPAENLHLIYGSDSYRDFLVRYKNRRQVIYAGGNDGLIHAFNGGWYNADTKTFQNAHGTDPGSAINYELGAELWAYAPYNTLPHLDYLMRPTYGDTPSNHVYFADLKPRIFDAKIFDEDTDHPGGWGTVLVVGMRLGGGAATVDIDLGADVDERTLQSSYAIFDVTNPDKSPELLLEFSHPQLGFTTSVPTPVTVGTNNDGDGDWYLMLGSGATANEDGFANVFSGQFAKLFLLDLKDVAAGEDTVLENSFGTNGILQLPDEASFISDLTAVDFGLDSFTTDAVYFGTVSAERDINGIDWAGKIYRVRIQDQTGQAPRAVNAWTAEELIDAGRPVTAPVSVVRDGLQNRWVYAGTGRYFTADDTIDNSINYYFGIKEPRATDGSFNYGTISASGLADVTSTEVANVSGVLSNAPALTPALATGATYSDLARRMQQYSDSTSYVNGWRRTFAASERNFGGAAILGGVLTYTSFEPVRDECSIDGNAYLYAVSPLTGTASDKPIFPSGNNPNNIYSVTIGSSPATTPSIHRPGSTADPSFNVLIQSADGRFIGEELNAEQQIKDGEASWRQLR